LNLVDFAFYLLNLILLGVCGDFLFAETLLLLFSLNLAALVGELALRHSDLVAQVLQLRLDILSFILLSPFFLFEISV
jgi:hypothetical protein